MKCSIDTKADKFIDIDDVKTIRILDPDSDVILCRIEEVKEGILVSMGEKSYFIEDLFNCKKGAKHGSR